MFLKTFLSRRFSLFFAVMLFAGFAACSGTEESRVEATVDPYISLAYLPGAQVDDVAAALVSSIQDTDERTTGMPDDWTVVGSQTIADDGVLSATLKLPGGHRTVELCNHTYASMALSAGAWRAVGLPCRLSLLQHEDGVEIIMLNPSAIFGLFFHDVEPEMAAQMEGLAETVRGEIRELVVGGTRAQATVNWTDESVGPRWTREQLAGFTAQAPAVRFTVDPEATVQTYESASDLRDAVVNALMETLTHEKSTVVGSTVPGLSVTDWRSARTHALTLPGDIRILEVCSPTYAQAALSTGLHHAPALPCKLAVYVEGDMVRVEMLDTNFVFPTFFSDIPAEQADAMQGMAEAVRTDILLVIDHVLSRI